MEDPRVETLARVLARYSLRLGRGDLLRILGSTLTAPLIRAVYREALALGAHPYVRVSLEGVEEIFHKHASDEQLRYVSEIDRLEFDLPTAVLVILGRANTRELANVPADRIALRREATGFLRRRYAERAGRGDLRWCIAQFPTQAEAQDAEMSLAEYEDFVFGAGLLDRDDPVAAWERVRREQERIAAALGERSALRIRGPGIDLSVSVAGRRWISAAGEANFPDGEVYTAPVEDSASGLVRASFPAIYRWREVSDVELTFERGRVVEARAAKDEAFLRAMLDLDAGARYLGEVAFGLNDGIRRFTRNVLFDEKIGGTFHLALGAADPKTGGRNASGLHWDMICDLRTGGEVLADGEVVYRDGRFLF